MSLRENLTLDQLINLLIEAEADPRCMATTPTNTFSIQIHDDPMRHVEVVNESEELEAEVEALESEVRDLKAELRREK